MYSYQAYIDLGKFVTENSNTDIVITNKLCTHDEIRN